VSARERLLKKRPRQIELDDGEKIPVRSLTIAESLKVDALQAASQKDEAKKDEMVNFIISRVMIEDDGTQIFKDETDPAIQDVPLEMVTLILEKVKSLTKTKAVDSIVKNSDATP
jgi:hypothetical protein